MESPVFSIITPIYNSAVYLHRCIDSVCRQSFINWELILIDDGSTDESCDICINYAKKDPRIVYYRQDNRGVSSARNSGISRSTGEWILFLDSDDELFCQTLESLYSIIREQDGPDLIIGGYEIYDDHGLLSYGIKDRISTLLSRDSAIRLMYIPEYYRYLGYICSKCYKSSIIRKQAILFNELIYFNEDRLFTTQYLCHCESCFFFTEPIYKYYESSTSVMNQLNFSFNPRFLTDLDGFIMMKRSIANINTTKEIKALADKGIAQSYWTIKRLMNQFKVNTLKRHISLHRKLLTNLPITNYFRLILQPMAAGLLRRLIFAK